MSKIKKAPPLGWTTKAKIIRVIDGDTVEIEIRRTLKIRLVHSNAEGLEFNAPESNTEAGQLAKSNLIELAEGKECVLFLHAKDPVKLLDMNTFDRVLGEVWVDDKLITQEMMNRGLGQLYKKNTY